MGSRTLYLFGSAAPPVLDIARAVGMAQEDGWEVCVGLTPTAADWLAERSGELRRLTGHPVRSAYKRPGQPDLWPRADAILFAPATFNSVNQWAAGFTSAFVIGVVAEAVGKGIPTAVMPCVNSAYVRHPAFDRSLATLRQAGVRVLYGAEQGGFVPNAPGQGDPAAYPWHLALQATAAMSGHRSEGAP